jgi:hypothetical protein
MSIYVACLLRRVKQILVLQPKLTDMVFMQTPIFLDPDRTLRALSWQDR